MLNSDYIRMRFELIQDCDWTRKGWKLDGIKVELCLNYE